MSIYDDMRKLNSDGYEEAYENCNQYWRENKENPVNYGINIDGLIKYWKSALPPLVDYAEMVGAPAGAYGCRYVYEDPDGYFIADTIAALEQLKKIKENEGKQ